uniref:VWFD domain-containing protein n=1 Tax=Lates calcarifer TaxID=8187 RepID=A0A4W6CZY1_LATCA
MFSFMIAIPFFKLMKIDNCTTAICSNGKVTEIPTACPTVQNPICTNGRKPVKISGENGCCYQNECECVCSVMGGSQYMTFDGETYDFKENCSYYLVKEIITKYNLTIIVNNHDCDPSDGSFCPQALIVIYQSYKVVFTSLKSSSGTAVNVVYVNDKRIYPAYSNSVLWITGTDMVITLEIPVIKTEVVYRNSSFSINLPYSLFNGNTEGQCGTCDNSKNNDCRSPNGQVESCSDSADKWHVPGTPCVTPTTPPTTTAPSTTSTVPPSTTPSHCETPICDLLSSSIFEPCHEIIAPGPFVKSCRSHICNGGNNSCSSLEAYATECAKRGVCINWRNATKGECEPDCPSNKVYRACGPPVESTCNDRYNKKYKADSKASSNYTMEGCFCPEGTKLFNAVEDICVTYCDCVGPDGKPKKPGDTWTSNCKTCVCDADSMSIQCTPVKCSTDSTQSRNCTKPGQQLVNKTDGCCTTETCGKGETQGPTSEFFKPGPCQKCYCGPKVDPITKLHIITCTPIVCNKNCSEGYEYQTESNKCCGKCVQTSCIFTTPDKTKHIIKVNSTYVPPSDKCVQYTCEEINGKPVTKETKTTCPHFNPLDCKPVS